MTATPNSLIHETSPYLLQHASNPVKWMAWKEEALKRAREENKLILISIGYSACHWCHVMEHESFTNTEAAEIMNTHFINIKVDREERPDIDQVYMHAVQLMTGHGGWPLNCFALPDGRPVYGGTYFPKDQWKRVLLHLEALWRNNPDKVEEYAGKLMEGLQQTELFSIKDTGAIHLETIHKTVNRWSSVFDMQEGGRIGAPKFPLPNNLFFLLNYSQLTHHQEVKNYVNVSLKKMAYGGIYDHLAGGFARYSVDQYWKVPHFEKMLYDNAQLISVYAHAFMLTGNNFYKEVAVECLNFVKQEFLRPDGICYSALDADSEGEEGLYYVWTADELKEALKEEYSLFATYYQVNEEGYWEKDQYILLRKENEGEIMIRYNLSETELKKKITAMKEQLLQLRHKRIKPGLDDKCLCSWNGLMIKAWCDAYRATGNTEYKQMAATALTFMLKNFKKEDASLFHSGKGNTTNINGFLEDYAFLIEGLIHFYQISGNWDILKEAEHCCEYAITHFSDKEKVMFYFTDQHDPPLITRKMELSDNVIPASNSQMARNLWHLGKYFGKEEYTKRAALMLSQVQEEMMHYGSGYSNWALLQLEMTLPFYEIVIVGKNVNEFFLQFQQHALPNCIFAGSAGPSEEALFKNRFREGKTLIYVCKNNTCQLPVESVKEAIALIN